MAYSLITQANAAGAHISQWTLGGGTAMMLQISHRESHDVDIFLHEPQQLTFLNPETNDFTFEVAPTGYEGDGRFFKISFERIGEIDFIATSFFTDNPTIEKHIEGVDTFVETVPEIIVKKVFFRGSHIIPRDIFDIAAARQNYETGLIAALTQHPEKVKATLQALDKLNPDYVSKTIAELEILEGFEHLKESALSDARKLLRSAIPT